jgi:hypothetical protein
VAQAISGDVTIATTSAIMADQACAIGPNAPRCAAMLSTEAMPIAPTPTGFTSYRWARRNSMPLGLKPSGLLITRSATTAMIQAMAMLLYSPSTWPSAWNTFSSISTRAIRVLNTTHTTRPGWLCVSREKKLLHARLPA